jgi:hypothetical protein
MLASMLQRVPAISYRWLAGWTIMWQARENGLFYARFNLCGDWHCWLSLSGLLLPAKVGKLQGAGPKRNFSANLAALAQATVLSDKLDAIAIHRSRRSNLPPE